MLKIVIQKFLSISLSDVFQFSPIVQIRDNNACICDRYVHACEHVTQVNHRYLTREKERKNKTRERTCWRQSICLHCDGYARLSFVPVCFLHSRREARCITHENRFCRYMEKFQTRFQAAASGVSFSIENLPFAGALLFLLFLSNSHLISCLYVAGFFRYDFTNRKFLIDGFCAFKSHDVVAAS